MSSTNLRQTVLTTAKHVVVKVGTQLLTQPRATRPGVDTAYIARLTKQIASLHQSGYHITLVSSGAIGCGCAELGLKNRPTDVAQQQAVAAVGQRRLINHMHDAFAKHGLGVGQVLLTRSDFDDRVRFLNIRNCITKLHDMGCVPVLNENDTVAVDEIRFGDNDLLAALTCNALRADALILLTVVDGLLDASGKVIDQVDNVLEHIGRLRRDNPVQNQWGSGGIQSKLEAARLVTEAGEIAVIASGRKSNVLTKILEANPVGTVFAPAHRKLDARQRWIGLTARPAGTLSVDQGAASALLGRGKSLLASGIHEITGRFNRGDILTIRDHQGREIARGLSNYSADELRLIMGKRSSQFEKILGRPAYSEVIHRDHLVTLNVTR